MKTDEESINTENKELMTDPNCSLIRNHPKQIGVSFIIDSVYPPLCFSILRALSPWAGIKNE